MNYEKKLACLRRSSLKRGILFNLNKFQYKQLRMIEICSLCNCELSFKPNTKNGWSLDRIDNKKSYNIRNVQVICRSCNDKKSNKEQQELTEKDYNYRKIIKSIYT